MTEKLTPRKRNKELERIVRNHLLDKRSSLTRELNNNRYQINSLAKKQRELKKLLTDINREIDILGIRIDGKE